MYSKILVPLDGSPFSECSISHVKAVAIGCHVPEVVLLRVVEPLSSFDLGPLADVGGAPVIQLEAEKKTQSKDYISEMAQKLNKEGVSAKGDVVSGKPAEQILDYAYKNHFDLIIMSTHGRSGISRWALGSVADRIVRHSTVPVLLVSPPGCRTSSS
jgi:nucleotide-binding universal stress UspA family protein